ncbi:transcription elongation factor Spt5 [Hesseltinella vesiculosa]|uniref:Transcription elongation factor SPT5 n=1 Tax=Hesseltinella vesiculosa TaxID=101127 RepID=A0A1X2GUA8_9FUNG|nr:transcription elongation factor Spt5 [Hesseltinella vesiculosa]
MARKRTGEDVREEEEETYDRRYDDEEVDDEEDDEEEVRPSKRKYNPFIDEMAVVDDEDEEEDEDEDYSKEDGFIEEESSELPSAADIQRRHMDLDRRRREVEDMDDEEVAAFYAKKYGGRKNQGYKSSQDVPQQLLLPSVSDPNLWVVKCKTGKEKDIIFGMMKRYFDRQYSDNPLDTFSAFSKDSLKGYIYIEARRQAHVQQALANIPYVYQSTLNLVPIKEMVDTINVVRKEKEIPVGNWVRVKRGKYAGDLGQILEVSDAQDWAIVKLVPRLDLDKTEAPTPPTTPGDPSKKATDSERPPQRIFHPERLSKQAKYSLQRKGKYWVFNGDSYYDGYLEKRLKLVALQTENVNPTLDEIAKFAGDDLNMEDGGERTLDLAMLSAQAVNDGHASAMFQNGDVVQVIEGDLIHSTGTVVSMNDTSVLVTLNIDGFKKQVSFPPKHLRKQFKEGDHVKVVNGRYKEESGMIINVNDNIVTLLSDATLQEVKVFAKDLREALDVSLGKTTIGNYELHDLVQLDFHTVGVITKVERNSFKVLTQNGDVRTIEPHQITHKRDSQRAVATDAAGNSIRSGDNVLEVGGEKRNCIILHLYRHLVFLHSRENAENNGVWVLPTRQVVNVAAQSARGQQQSKDLTKQQPYGAPNFGRGGAMDRGRGRGGFYGRGRGGRDNLVAKTVRITQGPHKGYVGIVKDTTDTSARVELHTNCKIINVDKAKLIMLDAQGGTIGPAVDGRSQPSNDFAVPSAPRRYGDGSMTPRYNMSGSKTPAWNSSARTPNPYASMDGSKTPAWDAGSKTPNPYADGSKTPAWDAGSKTPMWQGSSSSSARTPGFSNSGSKTPMWNNHGYQDQAPTPAAHHLSAQTPAASYTHVAPSPAPYPQTPAANYAQTPYDHAPTPYDSAPTPGGNLIPPTPAAMSAPTPAAHMMSAPTPGAYIPATPAGLQAQTPYIANDYAETPASSHVPTHSQAHGSSSTSSDWPIEDIEVRLVTSVGRGNNGQLGSIMSVNKGSRTCTVMMYDDRQRLDVPFGSMEPVRPAKKDSVKIFQGEKRGQLGSLIGVDAQDGIVRVQGGGGGFHIMSMASVGKYTGSEDVM